MNVRQIARVIRDAKAWRPATLELLSDGFLHRKRNALLGVTEREHLEAAAAWLARAQDSQSDGGVAGRYFLGRGWSSSYPETTGYIVPTMLALESEAGLPGFRARAQRCIEFLLPLQLRSGAFPGMEIAENSDRPSIFNSGQILNGLTAWHRETGDEATLRAAHRAASWLVDEQDADGAWRRHLYGSGRTYTYMAHAGCWIAEFGAHVGDAKYLDAARRHLEWVLTHVNESTGWINDCGFDEGRPGEAVTHTLAYTIWGVLMMSIILGHERGREVARRAARAVARRLELSKWLPGKLDAQWKGAANYACLTGNAQMALIWLELHRLDGDPALVNAACNAIDLVKRAQPVRSRNPGLRGGVAGSDPVWGNYLSLAVPNWAAKFFIDALLTKARVLRALAPLPVRSFDAPVAVTPGVPTSLPACGSRAANGKQPRIVMITDEFGHKVEQFTEAWKAWGFRPDAVAIRCVADAPRAARAKAYARDFGLVNMARRFLGLRPRAIAVAPRQGTIPWSGAPVSAYCAANGIPTLAVRSFENPVDIERVRELRPDLIVYAGGGIIRAPILGVARLGMLNAHMGMLPPMRGMNVAEWSTYIGAPVGCTVHLIDAGIDTGEILLFQPVDVRGAPNIDMLRQRVDAAQIAALGRVVQWVIEHGSLPPAYAQQADEGRQYFSMHDDLRGVLQETLRDWTRPAAPAEGLTVREGAHG